MLGLQQTPQRSITIGTCASKISSLNGSRRKPPTGRNGRYSAQDGRVLAGRQPQSLKKMALRSLLVCNSCSSGFYGVRRIAGASGNGVKVKQQSFRYLIRAEARSWQLGPVEVPKGWRFWEADDNWKTEASAASASMTNIEVSKDKDLSDFEMELTFKGHSVDAQTPGGELSPAAINTIEQFSRLNGITGKKMRANFEATAPVAVQNEAQNLVEFCVFRYLARSGADVHPLLSDGDFRRLTFTAMLAWQRPYLEDLYSSETNNLPRKGVVGEEAFVRIASSIPGAADRVTAHYLFRALTNEFDEGLTFTLWDAYLKELCCVHEERKNYQQMEASTLGLQPGEVVVSVGKNKRQPVQKWSGGLVWPGRVTLTDRALYFEANSLTSHQAPIRLDLTHKDAVISRKKVGPFGSEVFDSAISVASNPKEEAWVLEFVDFGGEGRRETWYAIVKEVITAYWFMGEYGPKQDDPMLPYMDGSKQGRKKAINSAINSIARLQAVQHMIRSTPEPAEKLLQFSGVRDAPSGELVYEALAVNFWAGRLDSKAKDKAVGTGVGEEIVFGNGQNAVGEDGSVYLSRWMTSQSWSSTKSTNFWKSYKGGTTRGLVLGKNYVVGGITYLDRAVRACREQSQVINKTKATIDGAKLKGIPNNVDLLKIQETTSELRQKHSAHGLAPQPTSSSYNMSSVCVPKDEASKIHANLRSEELLLPFSIIAVNLQKLKRWEEPGASVAFLFAATGLVYMNWLRYIIPAIFLSSAATLFALRGLKAQGKLGHDFGKLTIRDQPPTNTIQKIMALKEALTALENFLVTTNIALLKLRTVALSRHLRSTNEALLSLLAAGVVTWIIPFRYLFAGFLVDQFTVELPFRRKGVEEMMSRLNDWWSMIPATPVEVLPPEKSSNNTDAHLPEESSEGPNQGEALLQALSEWLGDDE